MNVEVCPSSQTISVRFEAGDSFAMSEEWSEVIVLTVLMLMIINEGHDEIYEDDPDDVPEEDLWSDIICSE